MSSSVQRLFVRVFVLRVLLHAMHPTNSVQKSFRTKCLPCCGMEMYRTVHPVSVVYVRRR